MIRSALSRGVVAAVLCAFSAAVVSPAALAQQKHDSNTLHKLGKAIEYPVRKTSENASVAAHRAEGRKSVLHRRNGNRTYRSVVTSNGRLYRKSALSHSRRHRHHRHHH